MSDVNEICYLQVKGKNQFEKEMMETRCIGQKIIESTALHRNEKTQEIEGFDYGPAPIVLLVKTASSRSLESTIKHEVEFNTSDKKRKV
jgi:hypothetical protein